MREGPVGGTTEVRGRRQGHIYLYFNNLESPVGKLAVGCNSCDGAT